MKLLLILLIFGFSLNANEMKRIDAIVHDITKLRTELEACQNGSKIYELQFKEERDKNRLLLKEINSFKNLYKREIEYKNKINILKNKIKEQNNLLKTKEKKRKNLNREINKTTIIKENMNKSLVLVECEEPNPFPKLVMKKEFKKVTKEKIEKFKASAFRLSKDAFIYDGINGNKSDKWSIGTSFTSSEKTQNWVKITGYFVNKVWIKSSTQMWIKFSDVIKR